MTSYRIVRLMTSFVQKILVDSNQIAMKQMRQKDVVCIVTFDLIGLLPSNHIISYCTCTNGISEFMRLTLTVLKIAQTMQNILKNYCLKLEPTGNGKLWDLALRLFSYSNLDLWRLADTVHNLESRRIIWESWQPCLHIHTFPDSNSIKRTFLGKFHNDNAMYSWFATTLQGGHVGGQSSRIFSQRIYLTVVVSAANQ